MNWLSMHACPGKWHIMMSTAALCRAVQGFRDRLDSSACFPGIHVCEVAARLHRVR